jgi:hypothetical protein
LLIISAGNGGTARRREAVEAREPFGFDRRANSSAGDIDCGNFGDEVLLAGGDARADGLKFAGESFDLGTGPPERSFL